MMVLSQFVPTVCNTVVYVSAIFSIVPSGSSCVAPLQISAFIVIGSISIMLKFVVTTLSQLLALTKITS